MKFRYDPEADAVYIRLKEVAGMIRWKASSLFPLAPSPGRLYNSLKRFGKDNMLSDTIQHLRRVREMIMQAPAAAYGHIALDKEGNPVIAGTSMKVVELVAEKLAYGWSPEEIHFQHPYLNMGQIYSTLAYYADHQKELEAEIARRLKNTDEARRNISSPRLAGKLKKT